MAHIQKTAGFADLRIPINALIEQHGAWRVLVAAVMAPLRGHGGKKVIATRDLNDHLRRDVGLPPAGATRNHWDYL
ncbi:hypothetical protein [Aliiroseovarius sp. YM-037]|uniref:hypothetical protein n=1 Tax=Aliiroseovarius sp. YM-037 TaxID=3341728 RepID=UPI003A801E9A